MSTLGKHGTDGGEPQAKRFCVDYDDMMWVLAGPQQTRFGLHKERLCSTSKYFKAACSASWLDRETNVLTLPELDPELFHTYVTWFYTGNIESNADINRSSPIRERKQEQVRGIKLYILADYIDDLKFCNAVMEMLVTKNGDYFCQPSAAFLCYVWDNTPENSLLRKFLVDHTIMRYNRIRFAAVVKEYPSELVHAIAVSLMDQTPCSFTTQLEDKVGEYLEPEADNMS